MNSKMNSKTSLQVSFKRNCTKADLSMNWRTHTLPEVPKKIYTHMALEDYPPYKEARASVPIGIYGPAPFNPSSCGCGRFIVDDFCKCVHSQAKTPKATWARENPEEYKIEQGCQTRWKKIWYIWYNQFEAIETLIYNRTSPYAREFERLRDKESEIDCYECQTKKISYCKCDICEGCGSKYCYGCPPSDDDDYYDY